MYLFIITLSYLFTEKQLFRRGNNTLMVCMSLFNEKNKQIDVKSFPFTNVHIVENTLLYVVIRIKVVFILEEEIWG